VPATDLVVHSIPTYAGAKPHRAREIPSTPEEEAWQLNNLPNWLGVLIGFTQSPWVAKTTFVPRKDSTPDPVIGFRANLRMVHTYCVLNRVTIKSNYPMKRLEPIIDELTKESRRFYFSGDATLGFYTIPLLAEHAYKTAFNIVFGQCCYLRMGMGLTGAPHTYARLKDITWGPIPKPYPERSITEIVAELGTVVFKYFFDDDYGAADDFESMFNFLLHCYFPRMSWAKLSLKPTKLEFMVSKINPLGLSVGLHLNKEGVYVRGVKASMAKLDKLRDFPIPSTYEEVEKFLYLTLYLKMFIPGRADHARVLKESCMRKAVGVTSQEVKKIEESREMISQGVKESCMRKAVGVTSQGVNKIEESVGMTSQGVKKVKRIKWEFCWGPEQQVSFDAIRDAVI